jgi:hypothetical protein
MKHISLIILTVMCLVGLAFTSVYAQPSVEAPGTATASVVVVVNPNIAVQTITPVVDAGTVMMGDFTADLAFQIDANVQTVSLFMEASPLYKGDDPNNDEVAPIPINTRVPVAVTPTYGHRTGAAPDVLAWEGEGSSIGDYPTTATETAAFESSQNGHYSQVVGYTITYSQPDAEKPQGQYSGKVRLTVLL